MARYAEIAHLEALAMLRSSLASVSTEDKNLALESASDEANSYLRARYTLPLTRWDTALRQHVVNITVYRLMSRKGFDPGVGSQEIIRLNYEDALRWLRGVQATTISPDVEDSAPPSTPGSPSVRAAPVFAQVRTTDRGDVFGAPDIRGWSRG